MAPKGSLRGSRTPGRACIGLVVLVGMSFASLCGQESVPVPLPPMDAAELLPASAMVHLEIDFSALKGAGGELALNKLANNASLKAFFAPLGVVMQGQSEKVDAELRKVIDLGVDDLFELFNGPITLSLVGMERLVTKERQTTLLDVVLTAHVSNAERAEKLLLALASLVAPDQQPSFSAKGASSLPWRSVVVNGRNVYFAVDGDMVLVGTRRETLDGVVRRRTIQDGSPTLAVSERYRAVTSQVRRPKNLLLAWLDSQRVVDLIVRVADLSEQTRDALALSGFDGFAALGFGMSLDGAGIRDRMYALTPERRGWIAATTVEGTLRSPAFHPADTAFFTAGLADFTMAYDEILRSFDSTMPRAAAEWRHTGARFQRATGVDIRDDLLAVIGPEWSISASWPRQALIPDLVLAVSIRDRARFLELIDRILGAGEDDFAVSETTSDGVRIRYLVPSSKTPESPGWKRIAWRPSIAMIDDYAIISLWPQSIKNLASGLRAKTPRLSERKDFVRGLQHLQRDNPKAGSTSLTYADLGALTGFLCDTVVPIVQSAQPGAFGPVDPTTTPDCDSLTSELFGLIGASQTTHEGILTEVYSPMGFLPFLFGAMAGFAMATLAPGVPTGFESGAQTMVLSEPAPEDGPVRARFQVITLRNAVITFSTAEGRLPEGTEWPNFVFKGSPKHATPFVSPDAFPGQKILDPWGRELLYEKSPVKGFRILSLGRDGKPGGSGEDADIIAIWKQ